MVTKAIQASQVLIPEKQINRTLTSDKVTDALIEAVNSGEPIGEVPPIITTNQHFGPIGAGTKPPAKP